MPGGCPERVGAAAAAAAVSPGCSSRRSAIRLRCRSLQHCLHDVARFHHGVCGSSTNYSSEEIMHRAILMNADIDKRAEVSDVSDRLQNHPRQRVVHGFDAIGELRGLNSGRGSRPVFNSLMISLCGRHAPNLSSVKSAALRVTQFVTVAIRSLALAASPPECVRQPDRLPGGRWTHQRGYRRGCMRGKPAHCSNFRPQTAHLQRFAGDSGTDRSHRAGDDVLRHHCALARDAGQQRYGRYSNRHADGVYAVFDHRISLRANWVWLTSC